MTRRTRSSDPRTAVAYLRVSTEEQRNGPEAQRAQIEAWAQREGATIVAWYLDEGISGASGIEDRPALSLALAAVSEARAGTLVVAKRDRIARDIFVAKLVERDLTRRGARIVAADGVGNGDTPADQFMRTILDGVAAFERDLIRARIRAALNVKRARGERVGQVPFGCRLAADGRNLEPDEGERRIIARIRELHAAGVSQRRICATLQTESCVSRSRAPLSRTQVARILAAPPDDQFAVSRDSAEKTGTCEEVVG